MSKFKVHFNTDTKRKWPIGAGECGSSYGCIVSRVPGEVTCLRCKRTKAYREAVKAAEEKDNEQAQ